MPTFPEILVPDDASEELENVGSKEKFWYTREDRRRWLFKTNRPNTGEDWAEKVAAELCALLGLPHATYELAEWNNKRGVISLRMGWWGERLVLGNELLAGHVLGYTRLQDERFYRNPQYTLDLTLKTLSDPEIGILVDPAWTLPAGVQTASEAFLGFLLLDAWIGNTDRHDKNWGVLERPTDQGWRRYLAPTFDHASSLGRELLETERNDRLTTRDQNRTVEAYLRRARSGFFHREGDRRTMHPVDAFRLAAEAQPEAAQAWLDKLADVREDDVQALFARIPASRISPVGTEFALNVLTLNREALLGP